ncbi:hypothetical protein WN982_08600 [Paraburkholderia sp. IMGN_8]|uniref:hypothetical protein n=1 Tax=Paraburkholderia sp. IMGN_8 TaxID=3136564 RepID=UPI0031011432
MKNQTRVWMLIAPSLIAGLSACILVPVSGGDYHHGSGEYQGGGEYHGGSDYHEAHDHY